MEIDFNKNWKIIEDKKNKLKPYLKSFNIKKYPTISLPDDRSIIKPFNNNSPSQNEAGLLDGGVYYYIKDFCQNDYKNYTYYLKCLGSYMITSCYINGEYIATNYNGYTPFTYDITNFLKENNRLCLKVTNTQPSSRWYSGTGIYQDITLIRKNKLHLIPDTTYITSPYLSKTYKKSPRLSLKMNFINNFSEDMTFTLKYELLDFNKNPLKEEYSKTNFKITSKDSISIEDSFNVTDIKLWSVENPNLYYVKISIILDECVIDENIIRFGFRFIDYKKEGLFLNGDKIKIKGVCLHHDNGLLGAIQVKEAIYRKLKILKKMGVNAIRSSHNMASDLLVYFCDVLGFLLLDEAFDCLYLSKKENDYAKYFNQISDDPNNTLKQINGIWDLKKMIIRDRNCPSVFMYSIGNELKELYTYDKKAYDLLKLLIAEIRKYDNIRPITCATDIFKNGYKKDLNEYLKLFDVVGLNYSTKIIKNIKEENNDYIFLQTEVSSSVKSRGVYIKNNADTLDITSKDGKLIRKDFQLSSYGKDIPSWGESANNCLIDSYYENTLGEFIWSGFDYIGEPTPWLNQKNVPCISSYFGIVDIAGFEKDDFYLYKSQWDNKDNFFIHLLPHYNFSKKDYKIISKYGNSTFKNILINAYTNLASCELFLNDKSMGKLTFDTTKVSKDISYKNKNNLLYLQWSIPYNEDNFIKVIGYDKENNAVLKKELFRIKEEKKIQLSLDYPMEDASIFFIKASVYDNNNNLNPISDKQINLELIGDGIILGKDNGNSCNRDRFYVNSKQTKINAFNGLCLFAIKKYSKEQIKLIATGKKLQSCEITI